MMWVIMIFFTMKIIYEGRILIYGNTKRWSAISKMNKKEILMLLFKKHLKMAGTVETVIKNVVADLSEHGIVI